MSVLIKNMEMPECCYDCPLIRASVAGDFYCVAGDGIEEDLKKLYERRMPDCPLVEVKEPHGRLIDVDGFKQDYSMGNECADCEQKQKGTLKSCEYDRIYSKMDFCQWLDDAETIIEAAEGSE